MLKLINLELKRTRLTPYWITCLISTPLVIWLIFSLAAAKSSDGFSTSGQTSSAMVGFFALIASILAAVMLVRFVLKDYTGQERLLLFSYPLSRITVFLAKLVIVLVFCISFVILASLFTSLSLALLNPSLHITHLDYDLGQIFSVLAGASLAGITALGTALIGLLIGFWIKSGPAVIITPVVFIAFTSNIIMSASTQDFRLMALLALSSGLISGGILTYLGRQIQRMEIS
ncbi:hypothetical protein ACVR1G_07920 [Streptococcus dentasini]